MATQYKREAINLWKMEFSCFLNLCWKLDRFLQRKIEDLQSYDNNEIYEKEALERCSEGGCTADSMPNGIIEFRLSLSFVFPGKASDLWFVKPRWDDFIPKYEPYVIS